MFTRIYIHNFRCVVNWEIKLEAKPSVLLIGKNGSGKSTIGFALALLQSIGRGASRVGTLVKLSDFYGRLTAEPMRFEIDVLIDGLLYEYQLALELPESFKELRVQSEELRVGQQSVYSRKLSKVSLARRTREGSVEFGMDWHTIALPIIQEQSGDEPLNVFKRWLARSVIIAPTPSSISGESSGETLEPVRDMSNLGAWSRALLTSSPSVYSIMDRYLKQIFPDYGEMQHRETGPDAKALSVQFRNGTNAAASRLLLPFSALSDGEKCYFICAHILAAQEAYGPVFCFWDELDNHLSIDEVGHFVMELRRAFENGGQCFVTSHNLEAIRNFSEENTLVLFRTDHLSPTRGRWLQEFNSRGDLLSDLVYGNLLKGDEP